MAKLRVYKQKRIRCRKRKSHFKRSFFLGATNHTFFVSHVVLGTRNVSSFKCEGNSIEMGCLFGVKHGSCHAHIGHFRELSSKSVPTGITDSRGPPLCPRASGHACTSPAPPPLWFSVHLTNFHIDAIFYIYVSTDC